jgi:transposase, IS605 orfB family
MLAERKESYESTGESTSRTPAGFKEEFPFLNEVDSRALATEWMNLNKAYGNFFRDKSIGFPKFKSKKNDKKSYTTILSKTRALDTSRKFVKLPKIGFVRCKIHRKIPDTWRIKSATISQSPTGKFYVSILCEYETEIRPITPDRNNAIGIDYKSNGFGVTSEGETLSNHRYFRENQSKLSREQRRLSRKKKNSKNFKKQKLKIALIYEHIANCRKEQANLLSHLLAEKYDVICLEDINLQNIAQSLNLGKSTNDNGFGMFRSFLKYKMEERGKYLIYIDKWDATSTVCSECGTYHKDIVSSLKVRKWTCPDCGAHHDRDVNAAKNVLRLGLERL